MSEYSDFKFDIQSKDGHLSMNYVILAKSEKEARNKLNKKLGDDFIIGELVKPENYKISLIYDEFCKLNNEWSNRGGNHK